MSYFKYILLVSLARILKVHNKNFVIKKKIFPNHRTFENGLTPVITFKRDNEVVIRINSEKYFEFQNILLRNGVDLVKEAGNAIVRDC